MDVRLSRIVLCFILITLFLISFKEPVAKAQAVGDNTYQWRELSFISSSTRLSLGDDSSQALDLQEMGFQFSFFGELLTQIKISSNGYLTFGNNDATKWGNEPLVNLVDPNSVRTGNPGDVIAPFWTDLDPSGGGSVYYLLDRVSKPARLIIEWCEIPMRFYTGEVSTDTVTFEVVLCEENNNIAFLYKDVLTGSDRSTHGGAATVGLKYHNQIARQYSYNSKDALNDGMSILFTYVGGYMPQQFQGSIPSTTPTPLEPPPFENDQTCEPIIGGINPSPNSTNVAVSPKITMNISTNCAAVDRDSIRLTVEGLDISGNAIDIACDQNTCTLSYEPARPFECSTKVPIRVEASDKAGYKATLNYFFSIQDKCKPYVESSNPLDQSCIPANPTFSFTLSDIGSGVDTRPGSLHLIVNGHEVTGASITPIGQSCIVSYTPTIPFEGNQQVSVKITAKDLASPPNSMEANFVYTVCSREWTHYRMSSPVSDLALDKNGRLWIATLGDGLFRYAPKSGGNPSDTDYWTDWANHPYTIQDGLPSNFITCLAVDNQGYIWLCSQPDTGTGGGIVKFDPSGSGTGSGTGTSTGSGTGSGTNSSTGSGTGSGTGGGQVIDFFPKGQNGLPDDFINDMVVDPNGCVWVATQRYGVIRLKNQQWQVMFDIAHGMTENCVKALALDNNGNKWVAAGCGDIYKFNEANQMVYNSGNDSSFTYAYRLTINSLTFDPVEDTLWVAAKEGAYQYHANQWSKVTGLLSNSIYFIFSGPATGDKNPGERYWFATADGIFATTDWSSWKTPATLGPYLPAPGQQVKCVQQDTYGNLWFITDSGISRLDLIPPVVVSITPNPNASDVSLSQNLTITFSEPMDWDSLLSNIKVSPDDSNFVAKPSPDLISITFTVPSAGLAPKTTYQISIDQGVTDISGNPLSSARTISFVTMDNTPPPVTPPPVTPPPVTQSNFTSWWWGSSIFQGNYNNPLSYGFSNQSLPSNSLGSSYNSIWGTSYNSNNSNWSLPSSNNYYSSSPQLNTNYGTDTWSNWLGGLGAN